MKLKTIEDAMREHADPVVSVPELAEDLDVSDTHLRKQLRLLEREDVVGSKDVGARATAWWHEDRVTRPHVAPAGHPDQRDLEDVPASDDAVSDDSGPETGGAIAEILEGWHPGRSRDERRPRRAAGRAALETLRGDGEMTRADFEDALLPEYDVEDQNRDTWWKKSVRAALTRARDVDVVEHIHGPPHRYEWTGDDGRSR